MNKKLEYCAKLSQINVFILRQILWPVLNVFKITDDYQGQEGKKERQEGMHECDLESE